MCDPVNEIAKMQVELEAKEPVWIAQLEASIAARSAEIAKLEWEQLTERTALTFLKIRKEKAEADQ